MKRQSRSPPPRQVQLLPKRDPTGGQQLQKKPAVGNRFNAGQLAVHSVILLLWLLIGLLLYKVFDLIQLLPRLRKQLAKVRPALKSPAEGGHIITWAIVLLSMNVATTIGTSACGLYVSVVYTRSVSSPTAPSAKQTKRMLRTMGTLLFYLALLPDSLATLILSGLTSTMNLSIAKRVTGGRLSPEAVQDLARNLGCPGDCWRPDGGGAGARAFAEPVRRHLRQCYLAEAGVLMALILIAFAVTHLIRSRGGLNHRELLESTPFRRLDDQMAAGARVASDAASYASSAGTSDSSMAYYKKVD